MPGPKSAVRVSTPELKRRQGHPRAALLATTTRYRYDANGKWSPSKVGRYELSRTG
jgi:hypothetical protein